MSCHTWMTRSCRTDKGLKLLIDPPLPGGAEEVGAAALRHVLGVQLQQPLHAGGAHLGGAETQAASLPDGKGGAQAQAPQDAGGGQELGGESVGRPHIARVLQKRGIVSNFAQAFELYLGYYGAAYVPRTLLTPEEGVSLMADLGAVVSFAHPMLIRCPPSWFDEIIPRLKEAGLGAIEAYHSEHSARDERFCVELAARYGLGLSGGSDYHGMAKPGVELGRGKGGLRVTVALLDALKARRKRPVDDALEVL